MIKRTAQETLMDLAGQFKAVAVVGPRQSGKTTLVKTTFPQKAYVSLENPDIRTFATEDPRGFLSAYPDGAILDEIQRVPPLFSYLQEVLDESGETGKFILTGSNHFLLQENIAQTLAGRVGYIHLLPLSLKEIGALETDVNTLLFKGGYPALYQNQIRTDLWYANYIRTYVERDVRLIKNITDLPLFERFLRLCAGRTGQLLNMSNLAMETGVDSKTIDAWINILETSFIVFRLQPYHKNFNKRIVKMPKLYFYDTGLACALMGIEEPGQLMIHPFRGGLFENLALLELLKKRYNAAKSNNLFFWRDNVGNEVDIIQEMPNELIPYEVKSSQTITSEYTKGIEFWNKMNLSKGGNVIYGGHQPRQRSDGIKILGIRNV